MGKITIINLALTFSLLTQTNSKYFGENLPLLFHLHNIRVYLFHCYLQSTVQRQPNNLIRMFRKEKMVDMITLSILEIKISDSGLYECQVSSTEKISRWDSATQMVIMLYCSTLQKQAIMCKLYIYTYHRAFQMHWYFVIHVIHFIHPEDQIMLMVMVMFW